MPQFAAHKEPDHVTISAFERAVPAAEPPFGHAKKPAVQSAALALGCSKSLSDAAWAQRANYEAMVAEHARANGIPEALVHRVIVRESRYQPHLVGRGGTIGLMQIKLATARGLGYTGTAAGLHDPNTNLTYAVRYLAGAYRAANGNADRAVHYYAAGYYYAAKRQRRHHGGRHAAQAHAAQAGAPLSILPPE
jgi:soluble lytic murein transglycosylase-like protein